MDDQLVAHVAAIDEYVLAVAAGGGGTGADHPAVQPEGARHCLDRNGVALEGVAQHMAHPRVGRLGIQAQLHAAIVRQRESRLRLRQRQAAHGFDAVGVFGGVGFEKLAPCRRVEKQILDIDRGAAGAGRRCGLGKLSAFGLQRPGVRRIDARQSAEPRDRGNRSTPRRESSSPPARGPQTGILLVA